MSVSSFASPLNLEAEFGTPTFEVACSLKSPISTPKPSPTRSRESPTSEKC